jgi:hypothetical protein
MLAKLKGAFKRAMSQADLVRAIDHRLTTPPLPPEWREVLAATRGKADGTSLLNLWREEFRGTLDGIAAEPTWALQRARLLKGITNTYLWSAFHAAMKEAKFAESWIETVNNTYPKARGLSAESAARLVSQRTTLSACTEACLIELGEALYGIEQIKQAQLEVLAAAYRETQVLSVRINDRMNEDGVGDPELREALDAWYDEDVAPLMAAEWRTVDVMEEAILSDTFEVERFANHTEQLKARLVPALRRMPVRADETE